jgi:hypothetical protein
MNGSQQTLINFPKAIVSSYAKFIFKEGYQVFLKLLKEQLKSVILSSVSTQILQRMRMDGYP